MRHVNEFQVIPHLPRDGLWILSELRAAHRFPLLHLVVLHLLPRTLSSTGSARPQLGLNRKCQISAVMLDLNCDCKMSDRCDCECQNICDVMF